MVEPIYKIKKLNNLDLKDTSPLDKWFISMVKKRADELSLLDVSRMLRQEIYIDIAIPISWELLLKNPFAGEMYEGQLLELIIRNLKKYPENKDEDMYKKFSKVLSEKMDLHKWENNEEKEDFQRLVDTLSSFFIHNK